jgi:UDP-glucose:(heptosyl)LPS alpha-1,3-glucosyltransferase
MINPTGIKKVYKKVLFFYLNFVENRVFRHPKRKFLALSEFINLYCQRHFKIDSACIQTIYSGINLNKFQPIIMGKEALCNDLLNDYPALKGVNIEKPIYLFVGAFERKGLKLILEKLESVPDAQLVVIGKPEAHEDFNLEVPYKLFHIEFTRELPKFYSLADAFVFASAYEPFGLVIIEAAAMGCELFVTRKNVGSVELLENLEGIHIFEDENSFKIRETAILSLEKRKSNRDTRISRLREYSWSSTGEQLSSFIDR